MRSHEFKTVLRDRCINSQPEAPRDDVQISPSRSPSAACSECSSGGSSNSSGPQPMVQRCHNQAAKTQLRPDKGGERKKKWAPRVRTGCVTCRECGLSLNHLQVITLFRRAIKSGMRLGNAAA
ncbi:hypothetical protein LLEC1_02559 [Akanthomyces lecanii]|uniref:Uncharacterized protein n=1 Tax=Cordyceps confragosa TaxID=2714763 RepID=A0A179I5A5_CORDF|nr:hypothetical protein LLEC1_02559 [Akanthomyces lecanii]